MKRREERAKKAEDAYGKVPVEKFLALKSKADKPVRLSETLAERYQIGMHGARFFVSYSATCEKCGFSFSHRDERPVDLGR